MQSLLILTAVFALLASYLESTATPAHATMALPVAAKVIRAATAKSVETVATVSTTASKAVTGNFALNLNLPSLRTIQQQYNDGKNSIFDIFEAKQGSQISYHAELVFDAESGEDITGGKVHIKIPFG